MRPTQQFEISDTSHVSEARRLIAARAEALGFGASDQGRVALVVTEAARNLLKHANGGQVLADEITHPGGHTLRLLILDSGPGFADARAAMRDGYSTAGTPGNGLGAIRRMSDRFDLYTGRHGTALLCEFGVAAPAGDSGLDFAAIAVPRRGEPVSGDGWRLQRRGDDRWLMVVDGLGHGLHAADASNAALAVMDRAYPGLDSMIKDVHGALRPTRGAAVGIARTNGRTLQYLGVGNVACRVIAPATAGAAALDKQLVSHNGTVGHTLRRIEPHLLALPAGAVVVVHTDGLSTRYTLDDFPGLIDKPPAIIAGVLFQRHARPADDATVTVLRAGASTPQLNA
jgi:anti-sigma regulatory factor (Ser/Thr protein kinase)